MTFAADLLAIVALFTVLAPTLALPSSYTLSDSKISATFDASGELTALNTPGAPSVVAAQEAGGGAAGVWSASFVGAGTGTATLSSKTATCAGATVTTGGSSALTFAWTGCAVRTPSAPSPSPSPAPGANVSWVEHVQSSCSGQCLSIHSSGPDSGHCDRMPGCGHDAKLPYCVADAMKARCLNASGCTAFNTNGYLYSGGGAVAFDEYPLSCWTSGPPPGPPQLVDVTLDVALVDGLLEYTITFASDGKLSLWDYTLALSGVTAGAKAKATEVVFSNAARQMLGIVDSSGADGAVYFAAHDPAHIVKTCSANAAAGTMSCMMLALDATKPLHSYKAAFPIVITALAPKSDWWDISQVYRKWVLPNAHWTALGPLDKRIADGALPAWLPNVTLWVNNNWGGDPLGPNYGGDPEYVEREMLAFNKVLDLGYGSLGLHWYAEAKRGEAIGMTV